VLGLLGGPGFGCWGCLDHVTGHPRVRARLEAIVMDLPLHSAAARPALFDLIDGSVSTQYARANTKLHESTYATVFEQQFTPRMHAPPRPGKNAP
jgi:hypothetical protein